MTSSKRLAEYLRWAGEQPMAGTWHCLAFIGEWVRRQTGEDRAAPWGCMTPTQCARLLKREGVLGIMEKSTAGMERTDAPRRGDVGVVIVGEPMGAICTGSAWAVLTEGRVAIVPAQPLAAWRV